MVPVLHRSQQQSILACFVWKYLYFLKFFQAYTWKQVNSLTSDSLYPWGDLPWFCSFVTWDCVYLEERFKGLGIIMQTHSNIPAGERQPFYVLLPAV